MELFLKICANFVKTGGVFMYEVTLDQFSGPLDLLLHLIKESKVEIWDIQIEKVTKQYLDYIQKMEDLNLNIASEYLVMASELIEMKSKALLPRVKDQEEETEEIDPREQLVKKLLEYEQYKRMTANFKELELIRKEIYTKTPDSLKPYMDDDAKVTIDVTLDDLMQAFSKFLERKEFSKPLQTKVTRQELSIEDRRLSIRNVLKRTRRIEFVELFECFTKEYIVVTFLAILEMARKRELTIRQDRTFDSIVVEAV